MGPFLAASIGETTEWFNSGTERWRKRGGGRGQGSRREWRKEGRKGTGTEKGADGRF